ncbi:MAG: tyrosine-type recombinase/integrase [Flavobacteriaceae bacterium]|tara:strand:- start:2333 stop:3217 length:885 start_codon:yes stop_codon:yes gene_type:complete
MSLDSFIEYLVKERNYSSNTIIAYKSDLNVFKKFCLKEFNHKNLNTSNYSFIRSWIVSLVESGLTNRSVNRKISVLRSYFNFLLKIGEIEKNPLKNHKPLKEEKKVQVPFSENEINLLLNGNYFTKDYEGTMIKTLIELFYSTGLRLSEVTNLKTSSVDLINRKIKVLGKRNKERIIPIIDPLKNQLFKFQELKREIIEESENEFFFVDKKNLKLKNIYVYKLVNKYLNKVSTKSKRSPHMLRHSFATHLLNNGADINSVKELLGHASLAATQIYTHTSMEKIKSIYKKSHPRN